MDLIILNDGLYQLIPVTKQIMEGIVITAEVDCFDVCEILRLKLSGSNRKQVLTFDGKKYTEGLPDMEWKDGKVVG